MTAYHLWQTIKETAPDEFVATVSLLSEPPGMSAVDYVVTGSREEAKDSLASLTIRLCARTLQEGDEIIAPVCAK